MKLETWHSSEDKRPWKIVRTDSYTDVPGEIVSADEDTGECSTLRPDGNGGTETKTENLGPGGIKIVPRRS